MRRGIAISATVILLGGASPAAAQTSLWAEAGLGAGGVGAGGGPSARAGFGVLVGQWGGELRIAAHDGGEGSLEPGSIRFFGNPQESFEEISLLLIRSLRAAPNDRVLLGIGVGRMSGRRIDPSDGVGLADLDGTWGVPLEVAIHGGDGRAFGGSLLLTAHINGEAAQLGVGVALSLGWASRDAS